VNQAIAASLTLLFDLFKIFLAVVLLLSVVIVAKYSFVRIKGVFAEKRTRKILKRLPETCTVMNNLHLRTELQVSQSDQAVVKS